MLFRSLYPCRLVEGTLAHQLYGQEVVQERHRHRYEFNNAYRERLAAAGLTFSGLSPDGRLVEIVEIKDHPFFIAAQFHPEFISRPNRPQAIFDGFDNMTSSNFFISCYLLPDT